MPKVNNKFSLHNIAGIEDEPLEKTDLPIPTRTHAPTVTEPVDPPTTSMTQIPAPSPQPAIAIASPTQVPAASPLGNSELLEAFQRPTAKRQTGIRLSIPVDDRVNRVVAYLKGQGFNRASKETLAEEALKQYLDRAFPHIQ